MSIDGQQLRDLEHSDIVKMFQTREKVSLCILPARFKTVSSVPDMCTLTETTNEITEYRLWLVVMV